VVVRKTTRLSPFQVVYKFNPFTPLDPLPLPNTNDFIYKDVVTQAKFVWKKLMRGLKAKYNNKQRQRDTLNKIIMESVFAVFITLFWLHMIIWILVNQNFCMWTRIIYILEKLAGFLD